MQIKSYIINTKCTSKEKTELSDQKGNERLQTCHGEEQDL